MHKTQKTHLKIKVGFCVFLFGNYNDVNMHFLLYNILLYMSI